MLCPKESELWVPRHPIAVAQGKLEQKVSLMWFMVRTNYGIVCVMRRLIAAVPAVPTLCETKPSVKLISSSIANIELGSSKTISMSAVLTST